MTTPSVSLAPNRVERALAALSALLGLVVLLAIARGAPRWHEASPAVWAHLLTIVVAVALTPAMLLMRRGTRLHRGLGGVWMTAMFATAVISLFVRVIHPGHFSVVHLLSLFVIYSVPRALWMARHHRIAEHRRAVQGMVIGALLVAGLFTFPFGRMLGRWLFGG